jgi:HEAT repeats
MECRELTEYAIGRLTGATDSAARQALDRHLAGCVSCRNEIAVLEETWEILAADPDATVTPEFRDRTLELLDDELLRRRIRTFRSRPRSVRRTLLQAAAVLVAAAAGFFAAREIAPGPASGPGATATTASAAPGAEWPDLGGNPRLTNVAYRTGADGTVGLDFDSTTRHSVAGRPDDPRMSRLLAYMLSVSSETAGEKSRAIELVSGNLGPGASPASPEIVRALATTLKRDRNPGVRKKAAEALASFRTTPEIRSALLDALAGDANPGVRLVAVDALAAAAKEAPDSRTIESLREKAFDPSENGFVRARAASALKAIDL